MEFKGNNSYIYHNADEEKVSLEHSIVNSSNENPIINSPSLEDDLFEVSRRQSRCKTENECKLEKKFTSMKINLKKIFFDGNLLGNNLLENNLPENKRDKTQLNWEYVIILNNPKWHKLKNSKITYDEAENLYRDAFKRKKNKDPIIEALQYDEEIDVFNYAFNSLEDFEENKNSGKMFVKGGCKKKEKDQDKDKEIKFLGSPSDFSTLIHRLIFYKLVAHLGLTVKKILPGRNNNYKHIYYLITADEEVIENEAERIRFNKQLEISLSDLISIFPCDLKLRPLHLLESPYSCIDVLYEKVRFFFHKAFETCEYSEKQSYKHKATGISLLQWKAYETFLEYLNKGIKLIPGDIIRQEEIYIFWKLVKKSLSEVNKTLKNKDRLKNLWDYLNISKPIAPYAEFRRSSRKDEFHELWRKHSVGYGREKVLFRNMERIRLINSYIETAIDLHLLEAKGFIAAHFPFHTHWEPESYLFTQKSDHNNILKTLFTNYDNSTTNQPIMKSWRTNIWNQQIPLRKIRNYFGEKIALYFEFLRLSQKSLIVPSLLGLGLFIMQVTLSYYSSIVLISVIVYSVIMISYSVGFLEYWKRRESSLAIKWGQTKFEKLEIPRGHFNGKKRRNPITDELDEVHLENWKRWKYFIISYLVTSVFICLVISIVVGLFFIKQEYQNKYVTTACSFINALQIQVFNKIYKKIAVLLTEMENHKTQSDHEDSLILKTFAFQFVNSFNSLIYIAYIKGYTEGCFDISYDGEQGTDCMNELFYQLLIIFGVNYATNIAEIGIPYLKYKYKKRKDKNISDQGSSNKNCYASDEEFDIELPSNPNQESQRTLIKRLSEKSIDREAADHIKIIKEQFFKEYYLTRERDDTIYDYMELAMQFGYLTLFAAAFPLSPFLSFIGLWLEMLTDKYKLLELIRRPIPLATKNIGTWKTIFSFISIIAIFSNTAIFCYTSPTFRYWNELKQYQHIFFGTIVVGLLIIRDQIQSWIPDTPKSYEIIQQRHEYIISRILRGTIDEEIEGNFEYSEDGVFYKSKSVFL